MISRADRTLDVNATTARSIINWDSFSIGAGNKANFNLPDVNSAVLNRVTSPTMPTTIAGALNSNGHVYLVNPSGIVVSAAGTVNTNGFTASTFDVANSKFMAGGALTFENNGSSAAIINDGTINTGAGGAHLIANDIANNGMISSNGGNITMSGGGSVTLENGVTYVQPSMETLAGGISPTAGLIQNTGAVRATGAATSGGEVYLVNPHGKILHDGTIAAQHVASSAESTGGKVQLEAGDIALTTNSLIDASGTNDGGEVLVGGDWQGTGEMNQATTVTMEAGAKIDASATDSGDGGKVVLWSDLSDSDSVTEAHGEIIARGGTGGGNGGQIETSGRQVDTGGIRVDAGSANGDSGLWLIDPFDYVIDATAASNIVSSLNTGTSVTVTTSTDNAANGSSGNSADNGDITVASDLITGAMSGDATLTLQAARHIEIGGSVGIDATQNGNTARLNVKLWADSDDSGDGISIVTGQGIKTNGGSLTFGNGNTATIGGVSVKVGGDVYVSGSVAQALETDGGDITINGETIVANSSVGGVSFDSGGGDIVFGGLLNAGNQYTYVDGPDGQANSWAWARTDANNGTPGGSALGDSYLVTITSRLENAIAGIAADYRGAWIGAHRPNPASSYDWQWADGPEAGQSFFTQSAGGGGTAQASWYSNFGAGEPNGALAANGESVGQFFGDQGEWNDLHTTEVFSATQVSQYAVVGYVRETNLNPTAVTIDAGTTGSVTIGGVGGGKALASLDVTSAGVTVNGDALITTGLQNYNSSVNVTGTGNLQVGGSSISLSGSGDNLLLKATGNIAVTASTALQTNNGDITLWANSDADTNGEIAIGNDVTFNSANGLTNQLTGGGQVTIGGGADGNGDDLPDGFALSTTVDGIKLGTDGSNSTSIHSGGGDVSLKGQTSTTSTGDSYYGVGAYGTLTVDSGAGTINISGESTDDYGVTFSRSLTSGTGLSLISTASTGTAISINGTTSAASSYGVVFNNASEKVLQATGGGNIEITGTGTGSLYGVYTSNTNVLATTGDVIIDGGVNGINTGGSTFGQKAGTAVTAATGDVTLTGDRIDTFGANSVDTTGELTLQPFSDSFSSALSWPLTNVSTGSNLGGLTIGKSTNTTDITIASNQSVGGPVNLYGGNINVNADIDTTGGAASGDVLLKAANNITQAAGVDITTTGGDVTFWADSDDNNSGYVALGNGASVVTSGGNIVMGGGADSGSDGIPDGDAIGQAFLSESGGLFYSGVSLYNATLDAQNGASLDATAGDISINGTSTHTGGDRAVGVMLFGTKLTGDVIDVTGAVTDTGGTTTRYGISANGGTTPNNTNIQSFGGITLTGDAATPADQYSIRYGTNHEMSVVDGDITINSNGQLQYLSSQTLTLADTRSLIFNSDYDAEWRNAIVGQGGLIKQGTGELLLTSQNTYTGATAIEAGDLVIRHDAPSITTSEFTGPGSLTVESSSASFSSALNFDAEVNGVSSLTVGNSTNTADVDFTKDIAVAGPITVYGGLLDFTGTLAAGSDDITLVGNDLALADTVSSTGALAIRPQTSGTSIGVGTGSGTLQLSVAEMALLQDGFSSVTIGDATAGDLNVGGLTSLRDNLVLQAGSTADLQVTDSLSWSSDDSLTLSAGHNIWILDDIDVGGSAATLNLLYGGTDGTTAPAAGYNFYIDLGNRRTIDFADKAATLRIGNEAYTLIDSVADFTGMTASGQYALANGLDLSGTTYSDAVYDATFTGKFDGLGHSANAMVIQNTSGGNLGLFDELNGSTVRHLGVTNFNISTNSSSTSTEYRVGGLAGNVGGAGTSVSSVTTMDGIWSSGVISTDQDSTQKFFFGGGLVGSQNGGFMNMSRSYSTANVSTEGSYTSNLATGGLIGDIGINTNLISHTTTTSSVVDYDISTSYATGSIVQGDHGAYFGSGGLVGVIFTSGGSLTDSYSWSNVVGTGSFGGIAGFAVSGTYERNYTTQASVGAGSVGTASSYDGSTLPTATNNGIQLPTGWDSNIWAVGDRPTLKLLPTPPKQLYVQVVDGGTSIYGDSLNITYNVVDDLGSTVTFGTGDHINLTGTAGDGIFTVKDGAHVDNYSVSYLTGLGLTGGDAADFILNPYSDSGSYSVTARPVTLTPTNNATKVYDGNTSAPSGFTPTYTISNLISGDTGAAINHSSAAYNSATVLDATTLTIGGFSIASITGSNGSLGSDYSISTSSLDLAATITPKPIVVSGIIANDKIYDATTAVTFDTSGMTLSGIVGSDDLTVSSITGSFADKNVGTGKSVSLTNTTFAGADMSNYTFTPQTSATANITAYALNVSGLTVDDKTYDATTIATLNGTAGVSGLAGDDVSLTGTVVASFADKDAGTSKAVSVSGLSLTGTDSMNYSLGFSGLTADINQATLTVTANDGAKFVTKTDTSGYAGVAYSGFVGGDGIGDLSGTVAITRAGMGTDEAAGTYADALVASGLTSTNYDIQFIDGDYEIVPADQLLIRFGNTSNTYGAADNYQFLSAEYMDGTNTVTTLSAPTVSGNQYTFDDGAGGTATFDLVPTGATYGTGGSLNVGNYAMSATNIVESSSNFSNSLILTGNLTVNQTAVTPTPTGVTKEYDGTTSMSNLSLGTTGAVSGDAVSISGVGNYATRDTGSGLSYSIDSLSLGGVDAANYFLSSVSNVTGTDGVINAKSVTITGPTATRVYDGSTAYVPSSAELTSLSSQLGVSGDTITALSLAFDNKNVGSGKTLTPSAIAINDGNGGANYNVSYADNTTSSITRLSSVTWTGGSTGDWSNPANWAGGAIPDLSNVAQVVIPNGVTPTFNSSVAGPVEIDSLSGGNLLVDSGTLNVANDALLDAYTQDGGSFNVGGSFDVDDFIQNAGVLDVGMDLNVLNCFVQGPTATINVGGAASITHTKGELTVRNLTAGSSTLHSTNGGVTLGDVTTGTPGTLDVTAGNGGIGQLPGTVLTVGGTGTFTATGDVDLDNDGNDFQGPVNASGNNVTIRDTNGGLTLGTVTTVGGFTGTSTDGPITQSPGGTLTIGGTTTVTATQGGNPADVDLGNPGNDFQGPVNASGNNVTITDGNGGLTLGTVSTSGNLTATSTGGDITQTPTGSITVNGTSTFSASSNGVGANIQLANSTNNFGGMVNVTGKQVDINDLDGSIEFGEFRTSEVDDVFSKTLQSTVFDTNARHIPAEKRGSLANTFTGMLIRLAEMTGLANLFESNYQPLVEANVLIEGSEVYVKRNHDVDTVPANTGPEKTSPEKTSPEKTVPVKTIERERDDVE